MFDKNTKDNLPLGPQQGQDTPIDVPAEQTEMQTIPDIFYGGADPNIYAEYTQDTSVVHNTIELPSGEKKEAPKKQEKPPTPPVVPSAAPASAPVKKRSRTVLLIGGGVLFLLAFVSISYYFVSTSGLLDSPESAPVVTNDPPVDPDPVTPDPVPVDDPVIEDEEELLPEDIEEPANSDQPILRFPRLVISELSDLDFDDLTDEEEAIFGTDVGIADGDQDGYVDGLEVINLYHPDGFAPARLIDSPLVREYIHPTYQYRLYYPSAWVSSLVDTDGVQVLFSAITGDYVLVHTFEKLPGETFPLWFGRSIDGQLFTELRESVSRFDQPYYVRQDGYVAYYEGDTEVYVLVYYPGATDVPLYPHIMDMMIQSFRPSGVGALLPEQAVLPTPAPVSPVIEPTDSGDPVTSTETVFDLPTTTSTDADASLSDDDDFIF